MNKLAVILLLVVAGCGSIDQMNSNMQHTNELMTENIRVMGTSRETIETNTQEVSKSTEMMRKFESTIQENSSLLQRVLGHLSENPLFFPIVFFVILLLLLVPSLLLYFAFRALNKELKQIISRKK